MRNVVVVVKFDEEETMGTMVVSLAWPVIRIGCGAKDEERKGMVIVALLCRLQ